MKYIFSLLALTLMSFYLTGDIYSIEVKNINGYKIDLNQFRGKKMLFIVLPLSEQDTILTANQIAQLQNKYQSSLAVIGVPAIETGFKAADAAQLKNLYKQAPNLIITEGMNVKKGTQQSALWKWLTSKEQNHHFNQDVQGIGSKFFVDEGGQLYGVMGPNLKLTSPLMDKILSKQPPKSRMK
jgi:glutathione peroxidase